MDDVTVIRVVRQIRIVRYIQQPSSVPLVNREPNPSLPPPPQRNNRCLNAFILLIIYAVGIGSIVLGSIHLNDCPAEKMLPVGLIILGGMLMAGRLLNCVYDCRNICEEETTENTPPCLILLNLIFLLAEFGMFIAVCYYAFSINPDVKDPNLKNYCDNDLYKTSFYGCIVGLIFYALPIFCGCCVAICCRS